MNPKATVNHKISAERKNLVGDSLGRYYEKGLWRCHASPSGAHHWIIDTLGQGECKYCREKRGFVEPAGNGWWEMPRYNESFALEDFTKELLPIV
jgi:hypothetical protein